MKKIKRFICALLTVLMCTNLFPLISMADTPNLALNAPVTASSEYKTFTKERATDGSLKTSWYSLPTDIPASISVDLGASIQFDTVKIYWGVYDYTTNFDIQVSNAVSPDEGDWTTITSTDEKIETTKGHYITTTEFLPLEKRHVRIICNEKVDWSFEIFEIEVYNTEHSAPTQPSNLQVSEKTASSVSLIWDADLRDNISYNLYRETVGVANSKTVIYTGTTPAYTDSTVIVNNTYLYSVSSVINGTESDESETVTAFIRENIIDDTLNLAMGTPVTASSEYKTFLKEHVTDGTRNTSWYALPTDKPASISVDLGSSLQFDTVKVYWGIYDYATDFEIQVSSVANPGENDWMTVASTTEKIEPTTGYYITTTEFLPLEKRHVRIVCNEKADWSFEIFEIEVYNTGHSLPKAPQNLQVSEKNSSSVSTSWDAILLDDATYKLYRETLGVENSKILLYTGIDTSYTDTTVASGNVYLYSVASAANGVESEESEPIAVSADNSSTPCAVCNLSAPVVSKTYVKLDWITSAGATAYDIYLDGKLIDTVADTKYTDYGLFENKQYNYEIHATNSSGSSSSANISVVTMAGTAEQLLQEALSANSISLSWIMPRGEMLKIYRNNELIDTIEIPETVNEIAYNVIYGTYTDTGLQTGVEYEYTLVATNILGESSDYPKSILVSTAENLALGNNIAIDVMNLSEESIVLGWTPVENAERYDIYKSIENSSDTTVIYSGTNIKYNDTSVEPGVSYNYYVKAYKQDSDVTSITVAGTAVAPQINNTAYLPSDWFSLDYYADEQAMNRYIQRRLAELKKASINNLFCDLGKWVCKNGQVVTDEFDYTALGYWMKYAENYGLKIIACLNCSTDSTITSELKNDVIQRLNTMCTNLYSTGLTVDDVVYTVDGIQLDFEPYRNANHRQFILEAATSLRNNFGAGLFLSAATGPKNGRYSDEELIALIEVLDMVNPMIYDTHAPYAGKTFTTESELEKGVTRTQAEYIDFVKNTCIWYSELIAASNNTDCILAPTLPAYADRKGSDEETGGYPDPTESLYLYHSNYNYVLEEPTEKVENALLGIAAAIDAGAEVPSSGIFYWTHFAGLSGSYNLTKSSYYNPDKELNDWLVMWVTKNFK